jgi:GAF domain-containing protein
MNSSERTPSETTSHPRRGTLRQIWHWVTAPAASVSGLAEQRQARLLSSTMLLLTVLTSVGILSVLLSDSEGANLPIQMVLLLVFVVSYFISRTGRYMWAVALSTFAVVGLPLISFVASGDYSYTASFDSLIWTLVALVFANLFFSTAAMVVITLGLLGLLAALPLINAQIEFSSVFLILTLDLIVGAVALVNRRYRDLQERDRQSELLAANLELQAMSDTLETRVAERTRDLALATEIGNTISQVRQLDSLLASAAELVRARFELYYVQIYLVDEAGFNLVLRTGTGTIGSALVSQGHRLSIGPGSINGLAAGNNQAVVVADTKASSIFFANKLLPDTRSELAIPLSIADRVVGVLDLQSDEANGLTDDSLPAFGALAGQLAIAIENVRLFTEVAQARAELEARARAQSGEAWREFLDAIHRQEQMAFAYESPDTQSESELAEAVMAPDGETMISAPISVAGAAVGAIELTRHTDQPWTEADQEIVSAISTQVAQKIENLRLLAEAEQYRHEAEDAARRLVREGWQAYQADALDQAMGYSYDQDHVAPINPLLANVGSPAIRRPLNISGESIGHLDITSVVGDREWAAELTEAVANQLSAHIENLRLNRQTEQALATTEQQARRLAMLNEMSEALNRAATIEDIFNIAAVQTGHILDVDNTLLTILDPGGDAVEVVAVAGEDNAAAVGDRHTIVSDSLLAAAIREQRVVTTHGTGKQLAGITATMIAPLSGETDVIGALSVGCERRARLTASDEILFMQIAALLGATIERRRLADRAQARANREQILRQITTRIHAAADAQSVLRTAAVEINRALGLEAFVYLEAEGNGADAGSNGDQA